MSNPGIMKTDFQGMTLASTGKVRDIYAFDSHLLIVATDRISAFDFIMPNPVPGKGEVLTRMSAFWFGKMADIIPNHVVSTNPDEYPAVCAPYRDLLRGRSMLVKKAKPLPVECVVRGYLSGSGWKDYSQGKTRLRDCTAGGAEGIVAASGDPLHPLHQGRGRGTRPADRPRGDGKYHRRGSDRTGHPGKPCHL